MKRIICFVALLALILTFVLAIGCRESSAGTKTLTFAWTQPGPLDDLAGWKLYQSDTAGGAGILAMTIPYGGTAQAEYTGVKSLVSPDGQTKVYFFVLTSFDTSGNESGRSNEVSARIDFEVPGIPLTLKVTVTN